MLFNPHLSNFRPSDGTRLSRGRSRADVALFNESQSRIVITVTPENASQAEQFLISKNIPHARLGTVTAAPTLKITAANTPCEWPLETLRAAHEETIPSLMAWQP